MDGNWHGTDVAGYGLLLRAHVSLMQACIFVHICRFKYMRIYLYATSEDHDQDILLAGPGPRFSG